MSSFEFTFLAKEESDAQKVEAILTSFEGKKTKETSWGKRFLAYPINKNEEAEYVTWHIDIEPKNVIAFRQKLNFEKIPMRYLILKLED